MSNIEFDLSRENIPYPIPPSPHKEAFDWQCCVADSSLSSLQSSSSRPTNLGFRAMGIMVIALAVTILVNIMYDKL
jgi:hypothetical protein